MKTGLYLRSVIFGVSDSLVSTVGLLSGIGLSGIDQKTVILTGVVYAFVEAFSMAVGFFLSESSAEEYIAGREVESGSAIAGSIIMFVAFVLASFIPIFPYSVLSGSTALVVSILVSIVALFIMGLIAARFARVRPLFHGVRMALGGAAIGIGAIVGIFV